MWKQVKSRTESSADSRPRDPLLKVHVNFPGPLNLEAEHVQLRRNVRRRAFRFASSDGEALETTGLIATRQKARNSRKLLCDSACESRRWRAAERTSRRRRRGGCRWLRRLRQRCRRWRRCLQLFQRRRWPGTSARTARRRIWKARRRWWGRRGLRRRKKRKAQDARLKLPARRQPKKKVKLADDMKTEDGSVLERPRKKSERSNWLPSGADMPVRQSGRSLAVANREVIHANLKQSAVRSEKQRKIMKNAAERENHGSVWWIWRRRSGWRSVRGLSGRRRGSSGRWEREEAERQRLRDEAIAAKRKRAVDGPSREALEWECALGGREDQDQEGGAWESEGGGDQRRWRMWM